MGVLSETVGELFILRIDYGAALELPPGRDPLPRRLEDREDRLLPSELPGPEDPAYSDPMPIIIPDPIIPAPIAPESEVVPPSAPYGNPVTAAAS